MQDVEPMIETTFAALVSREQRFQRSGDPDARGDKFHFGGVLYEKLNETMARGISRPGDLGFVPKWKVRTRKAGEQIE